MVQASVVVVVYNEEQYIERCLRSLLDQSFSCFELIVVDDGSEDRTAEIIRQFKDPRIIYLLNPSRQGIAFSRNIGIKSSTSEHVFFIDADCVSNKYWLQEGMRIFLSQDCLGVEGRTCYETAWTSVSDRIVENIKGQAYNTCNIGYKKSILKDVGLFNESYRLVSEDTDLAIKVLKKGKIVFLPDMLVIHLQKFLTPLKCIEDARRVFSKIRYIKDTQDFSACRFRILYPAHLLYIIFPFLLLLRFRLKNLKEIITLFILYVSYIIERFMIWSGAIKERIFLI